MWGSDGARVRTARDGQLWIFRAVEHWNSEVKGWHATARGDRFAAPESIKQGYTAMYRTRFPGHQVVLRYLSHLET